MRQPCDVPVEKNKNGRQFQEQWSCESYALGPGFLEIVNAKDRAPIQ